MQTSPSQQKQLKQNEEKWGQTLMQAGFTVLPSIILERQLALGLDAFDVNILLHLAKHWWRSDNPPHPSKASIAECMQVDVSTIRRRIARMEKDGIIKRESRHDPKNGRQQTNYYHFRGLIDAATPYAQETLNVRQQRKTEDQARRTRKRPALTLVPRGGHEGDE